MLVEDDENDLDEVYQVNVVIIPVNDVVVADDEVDGDCGPESDAKVLLWVVDDDAECNCRRGSDVVGAASMIDASHVASAVASQIAEVDANVDKAVVFAKDRGCHCRSR